MKPETRIASLENLRLCAFFAVIVIHFNNKGLFGAQQDLGFLLDSICRFAVPLFFLLSGRFLKQEYFAHSSRYFLPGLKRLLPAYLFWFFLYNAPFFYSEFHWDSLKSWRKAAFFFFVKGGGGGYHLWFLPALYLGSIVTLFVSHWPRQLKWAFLFSCYFWGLWIQHQNPENGWMSRNGIFLAPIFLSLGAASRESRVLEFLQQNRFRLIFFGLVLHLLECFSLAQPPFFSLNLSLGLLFLVPGIYGLVMPEFFFTAWAKYVFGAYLVHAGLIEGIRLLGIPMPMYLSLCFLVLVFLFSLGISFLFSRLPLLKKIVF